MRNLKGRRISIKSHTFNVTTRPQGQSGLVFHRVRQSRFGPFGLSIGFEAEFQNGNEHAKDCQKNALENG